VAQGYGGVFEDTNGMSWAMVDPYIASHRRHALALGFAPTVDLRVRQA
jgi:hypothetical protein